jgi:hypothetical protein
MAQESASGRVASERTPQSEDSSGNAIGSRTRARSFEITDAADLMLKNFKHVAGVNVKIQIERMVEFMAARGRANKDQFFNLVMRSDFGEHEARQMIQLLAREFHLRVDIGPAERHA